MIVVQKNNYNFYEDLETIKDLLEFKKVEQDNFMNKIEEILITSEDDMCNTETCLETCEYVYQICYVSNKESMNHTNDMNKLGIYITQDHTFILGTVILLKFINNEIPKLDTMTYEDILFILTKKKNHYGIISKPLKNIECVFANVCYNNTLPTLELFLDDYYNHTNEPIHIIYDSINIHGYLIEIYYLNKGELSDQINKNISKLFKRNIYGDVVVVLKLTEKLYGDLTIKEFLTLIEKCDIKLENKTNRFLTIKQ